MSLPLSLIALAPLNAQEVLTGEYAFGTWEQNTPGLRLHITADALPPPSHTENDPEAPDYENMATVVPAPDGATPEVPEGFPVDVFVEDLAQPRVIRIAPNGDIFVVESEAGRVSVFAADAHENLPAEPEIFTEGLDRPFGIAFYPQEDPQYVYVAAADQVVRYPYSAGAGIGAPVTGERSREVRSTAATATVQVPGDS